MDKPNYANWLTDDASGLPYITEVGTLKRLYKHPPYDVCGVMRTSYASDPLPQRCSPRQCAFAQVERNDNAHPIDQQTDQGALFP